MIQLARVREEYLVPAREQPMSIYGLLLIALTLVGLGFLAGSTLCTSADGDRTAALYGLSLCEPSHSAAIGSFNQIGRVTSR